MVLMYLSKLNSFLGNIKDYLKYYLVEYSYPE